MSLVSEALKKAEREAVAREARARGLPAPLETPPQPYRARRGQHSAGRRILPLLALAGIAAAIALAVFVARARDEKEDSNKGATASTSTTASEEPATSTSTEKPPFPSVAVETPPRETVKTPSVSEPEKPNEPPLPLPKTSSPERPSASSPSEAPTLKADPRAQREYVRRIELADGTKLELGGIAYSDVAPFAYLNGKLLAVGERTAGFTLVRIERDRVVVRGATGDLTIRLKPN